MNLIKKKLKRHDMIDQTVILSKDNKNGLIKNSFTKYL